MEIYKIAKPEIDRLAEETGELANLLVEEHGLGSYLHRARGQDAVQVEAHVGTRVYLHSTALGKAILGHMPADRRDEILDRHGLPERTPRTTTEREELLAELETVREQGYAFDNGERFGGASLCCRAGPEQERPHPQCRERLRADEPPQRGPYRRGTPPAVTGSHQRHRAEHHPFVAAVSDPLCPIEHLYASHRNSRVTNELPKPQRSERGVHDAEPLQ